MTVDHGDRIAKMKEMQLSRDRKTWKESLKDSAPDRLKTTDLDKCGEQKNVARTKNCQKCGCEFSPTINVQIYCTPCGLDVEAERTDKGPPQRGVEKPILTKHFRGWLSLFLHLDVALQDEGVVFDATTAGKIWRCRREFARERLHRMLSHRMVSEPEKNRFRLRPRKDWLVE